jgi:hypothetical protein
MSTHSITVSTRFTGPPRSANGGYISGRLAEYVDGGTPVTVTLKSPPPLETELSVDELDGVVQLRNGDTLVAEAVAGDFAHDLVAPLDAKTAESAWSAYPGLTDHPFPTCFTCGTDRTTGDGLRLTPGLVAPGRTACVWVPHPSLASDEGGEIADPAFAWAALDCPGGWTSDLLARPLVLGRMTAQCDEQPLIGQPHVVVGRLIQEVGRKTLTATTLYDNDGRVLGRAEHVWIAIDPADFGA